MWVMQVFGLVRYTAPEISHFQLRTDGAKARSNKVQQIRELKVEITNW